MDYFRLKKKMLMSITHKIKGFVRRATGTDSVKLEDCAGGDWLDLDISGNSLQNGTPTPDTPIEIQSVGELVTDETDANYGKYKIPIVYRGKNLIPFPYTHTSKTENGITFTVNDDGSVLVNGTATKNAVFNLYTKGFQAPKTENYHYSGCPSGGSNKTYNLYVSKSNSGGWVSETYDTGNGKTWLFEEGYIYRFQIYIFKGFVCENLLFKPMLEKGSVATEWEPYIEPVTTNIYLDEPLRKIGDYADFIDFKSKKIIYNIGDYVINENTAWAHVTLQTNGLYVYAFSTELDTIASNDTASVYCLSNKLIPNEPITVSTSHDNEAIAVSYQSFGKLRIAIDKNRLNSIDANSLSEWLSNNPIEIIYRLAEPIEEPLDIDLPQLPAQTTIVEIDTSLAPTGVEVEYYSNVKGEIE